jgi:hypothetical protein
MLLLRSAKHSSDLFPVTRYYINTTTRHHNPQIGESWSHCLKDTACSRNCRLVNPAVCLHHPHHQLESHHRRLHPQQPLGHRPTPNPMI